MIPVTRETRTGTPGLGGACAARRCGEYTAVPSLSIFFFFVSNEFEGFVCDWMMMSDFFFGFRSFQGDVVHDVIGDSMVPSWVTDYYGGP